MSNNSNIASNWAGFRKLWVFVAVALFLLLLLLWAMGYGPGGSKCAVPVKTVEVEKVISTEKIVDNPELLTRIGVLEKENAEIVGLKIQIENLTKKTTLVEGLQAKIKSLEAIDLNFDDSKLTSRINLLETENASIDDLKSRIKELEGENSVIEGLQAKVKALENVDLNFKKNDDNTKLLEKIKSLEAENSLVEGLKAKVASLEAVDINFVKPQDSTKLLQKISGLEAKNLAIPVLESRIKDLESQEPKVVTKEVDNPTLVKRIAELETENSLLPGLKAKVKVLEAIDINFEKTLLTADKSSETVSNSSANTPEIAKFYFGLGSSRSPVDEGVAFPRMVVYLKANPTAKVSIMGFHDEYGKISWNRRLANKRANRVRQILVNLGISANRITVDRSSQTLGTGEPKEARRVEVKVIN